MKKSYRVLSLPAGSLAILLLLSFLAFPALSQMNTVPLVTIGATDPRGSWQGDPAVFTVFRHGPTNLALTVFYRIGGTAVNGEDYDPIRAIVSIPAGARASQIVIQPVISRETVTKTVELQLTPSPLAGPTIPYFIGSPSNAVVYIGAFPTNNYPPMVQIATPASGAVFREGADVPICARTGDADGFVRTVEFFVGTRSLGITTNNPMGTGPMNPFCLVWSNAPAGRYTLNALATDNGGATSRSEAVFIVVGASDSTNYPPIVRIMSPANGAVFPLGANVPIYAFAQDRDDRVASVEFFADRVSIGFGSNLLSNTTTPRDSTNVWTLVWRDAALGRHVLTARANDTRGAAGGSEPVGIAVVLPPEPPTNRPALITIAAVDPIAIEGTNCWPWRGLTNPVPTWTNWGDPRLDCRYYTNCGPKNATFLVRRLGATNDPVTVTYAIGGTATNGVDYVELPGSVTIPAGQRGARITVVPLDDGVPDRNRTVVLRLQPSAAVPADYVLGRPSSAAALIVDSLRPRPGTGLLADRTFHLNETGPDGAWFRVEFSTDMVNWNTVCINQVINGSIDFIDPDAAADQSRFYRAVPELDAPME